MIRVVVALEELICLPTEVKCFLGGGITNCPNRQNEVMSNFRKFDAKFPGQLDGLVLFNPRRENFPIDDPNAAQEQIAWEFKWLQQMDLFSMWFSGGESDQPICMYELGRNLQRMMTRFPDDYAERILISCDPSHKRFQDVVIQTKLAFSEAQNGLEPNIIEKPDPMMHMYQIIRQFKVVKALRNNENTKAYNQSTAVEA